MFNVINASRGAYTQNKFKSGRVYSNQRIRKADVHFTQTHIEFNHCQGILDGQTKIKETPYKPGLV
jgi:hypothetical protein